MECAILNTMVSFDLSRELQKVREGGIIISGEKSLKKKGKHVQRL